MFSIGHLSDLHATPVRPDGVSQLLNKRFFGWASWHLRRRHVYRPDVLDALIEDLREAAPDQVVVTGDLTNVALESEFDAAREWLGRIGSPDRVFVVPGNHDSYVSVPRARSWDRWSEYLASDPPRGADGAAARDAEFPTLRRRGPLALVGVCSALPTWIFMATGSVGASQLERLEALLTELADADVCRVVLIHHPITDGATSPRRSLSDAAAVRAVLRRAGADLVLHGHNHRTQLFQVPGPEGPIPVVGVRSSSYMGRKASKRAHYHLYDFEPGTGARPGARFRVTMRTRAYDPGSGRFRPEGGAARLV
jgi:3',5'-cyclic AMP phosphodiesterase CpdA